MSTKRYIALPFVFLLFIPLSFAQELVPETYSQLRYRFIGPQGNRMIAVAGVPGDNNICYAGAASGGIFKSIDGGINWDPIFDEQPVSSIGSLAVAPSDPNVVWAGTGETFIRNDVSVGNGVYKSVDAGEHWTHMGLEKTGRIGRIVIHPKDPDVVFAAAVGHGHGPQQERGVFRTTDGGRTWERILFVDEDTGCSDLIMDPDNSRILFAGMWPFHFTHWSRNSGGPGGGIFMSRDGGDTWKKLTAGLPEPPTGKIALAVSPDNSERIYAIIESSEGTLWRSDDGGFHWELVNRSHELHQRPIYYSRLAVAPDDFNEVYFVAVQTSLSLDGGKTYERLSIKGGDSHDIWIDPLNPDRIMIGNDQYVATSFNRGKTWLGVRLPAAQMYHVAVDNRIPYFVYGNKQDGPSYRGPSNHLGGRRGIPSTLWHSVGGGESGFTVPDPVDNDIVWSANYQGILTRHDLKTGHSRGVCVWREDNIGAPPKDLRYRFQWTFPITISPHDHNKVYVGSQFVHQTTNGGQSWQVISPDLSTGDPAMLERNMGPLTNESADPSMACTVFAIAESPIEEGQIWAGTNDGLLHITRDGGKNWTDVTGNIPAFPPKGKITNIEPSRFHAGTCYFSADLHEMNHWDTYVYKTTDFGESWKRIKGDIPESPLSYAHCIREDPVREGLLYLGTENMLYVSFNDGENWMPLQEGMPHAPVHWLVIQEHFNDLVVGTYGRGFYILDDISPLQQLTREALNSDVFFFTPRPAYRYVRTHSYDSDANDQCVGQNPPYGALINYYLKSKPREAVTIVVTDPQGRTVDTIKGTNHVGINRVVWDLRYETLRFPKLRTPPIGAPWVEVGPEGWRPLVTWGQPTDVKVEPGAYTLSLRVDGKEFKRELIVEKDPHSEGTIEDIKEQTDLLLKIRKEVDDLVGMINQIEWIRKQLYDLVGILENKNDSEDIIEEAGSLDDKLIEVESHLFQMKLTGAGQDTLRWPAQLYVKFTSLADEIMMADFRPTDQQVELYEVLKSRLETHQSALNELLNMALPAFNVTLELKGISRIVSVKK